MQDGKIVIARLWSRYKGKTPSRAPVILGLDPQRYQTICVYLARNSEKPNFLQEKGCKAFYIYPKKFLRMFNLPVIWKLSRLLKNQKVDILHCHRHKSTVYGAIAGWFAGMPAVISHVHGLGRTRNLNRKLINFFVLKRVSKIITVGEAVRENVLQTNPFIRPDKVVSLGNSIDYKRFAEVAVTKAQAKQSLALSTDSIVFGMVGRMAPTKGQVHLISAFVRVKESIPLAQLILVGDGGLRAELQKQAAKTSCADSIHFLGHRTNIPELLRAMDVFVLPSIAEGLPRCLLEAMAAGVPCVAASVGGIPEILANGEVGYLVPSKDECALADAMIELTKKTDEEAKQLVEKARQRVKSHYTHEVVIKGLEKLYETCMMCS